MDSFFLFGGGILSLRNLRRISVCTQHRGKNSGHERPMNARMSAYYRVYTQVKTGRHLSVSPLAQKAHAASTEKSASVLPSISLLKHTLSRNIA